MSVKASCLKKWAPRIGVMAVLFIDTVSISVKQYIF